MKRIERSWKRICQVPRQRAGKYVACNQARSQRGQRPAAGSNKDGISSLGTRNWPVLANSGARNVVTRRRSADERAWLELCRGCDSKGAVGCDKSGESLWRGVEDCLRLVARRRVVMHSDQTQVSERYPLQFPAHVLVGLLGRWMDDLAGAAVLHSNVPWQV
jgi:hypothetical protein